MSQIVNEIHLIKLMQLGATQKFVSQWIASEKKLKYLWSLYGHKSTKRNKVSWVRLNSENARLAEVIYSTFCKLHPNNKDLKFLLTPANYLNTHLAVICRENNPNLSAMYTISVLTGIVSKELVVRDACRKCGGIQLTHVFDIYKDCGLCRLVQYRQLTKNYRDSNLKVAVG